MKSFLLLFVFLAAFVQTQAQLQISEKEIIRQGAEHGLNAKDALAMHKLFFTPQYMLNQQVLNNPVNPVPVYNPSTYKPIELKTPEYPVLTTNSTGLPAIRRVIVFSQSGNSRMITTIRVE